MLTRSEIAEQLADLEGRLVPEQLTRREAEVLVRERLAAGLLIEAKDVRITWQRGQLHVRIPTRLHYVEHIDFILERLDAVARRVVFDFGAQTEAEFTDLMKRLRNQS